MSVHVDVRSAAAVQLSESGRGCDLLAATGSPVTTLLVAAAALLIVGVVLSVGAGGRGGRRVALVAALVIGSGIVVGGAGPNQARAAEHPCGDAGLPDGVVIEPTPTGSGSPENDDAPVSPFDIGQISTNVDIAPGLAPTPISGQVVNRGPEAIYVEAVSVEIATVTKAAGAVDGVCDSTDYDLRDPIMHIGRTLMPGQTAIFSGATIGFHNKPINQDACQAATVGLTYRTS
jgi:hypothetical protein